RSKALYGGNVGQFPPSCFRARFGPALTRGTTLSISRPTLSKDLEPSHWPAREAGGPHPPARCARGCFPALRVGKFWQRWRRAPYGARDVTTNRIEPCSRA